MEKLTYSVPELAAVLGIGRNCAYNLVHRRSDFPAVRIGRRIVVPVSELNVWLKNHSHDGVIV